MKKIIFSWFSIFVFATIVLSGVTHAQPIKTDEKLKPKTLNIPAKKGVADLVVKNVNITPPVPRAGKDMVKIKVTVTNAGNATPSKVCSLSMTVTNMDTHPD